MRSKKRILFNLILFLAVAPLAGCLDLTGMDELEDDFQALGEGLVGGWTDHGPSSGWGRYSVRTRDSTATVSPGSRSIPDGARDGRFTDGS